MCFFRIAEILKRHRHAYLVPDTSQGESQAKLVMVDGLAQTLNVANQRLFTTHFQDFTYDIGRLFGDTPTRYVNVRHLRTWELLRYPAQVEALTGASLGRIADEAHGRFAQALMCMAAALIGFATLLIGGYSRFGVWQQIILAIVLIMIVKSIEGVVSDPVTQDPAKWALIYVPPLLGLGIGAALLAIAARGHRPWFRVRQGSGT